MSEPETRDITEPTNRKNPSSQAVGHKETPKSFECRVQREEAAKKDIVCVYNMLTDIPDVEPVSLSHDSLGRGGGGGDEGGGGSCPGTPEMRRRQEEALRRLAGQVASPSSLIVGQYQTSTHEIHLFVVLSLYLHLTTTLHNHAIQKEVLTFSSDRIN